MRISNYLEENANPVFGTYQPHMLWGYSGGSYTPTTFATETFFTDKPIGTLFTYNRAQAATYNQVETWQKIALNGKASDWSCLGGNLTQKITVAAMTDGGAAAGTIDLTPTIPAGAFVMGSSVFDITGFAGDVSAVLIVGIAGSTSAYCTGTYNVFATAALPAGMTGQNVPSGNRAHSAATTVRVTITTSTDFTLAVTNAAGIAYVTVHYIY